MNLTEIEKLKNKGYGYRRIAAMLDISPNTVKSFLKRHAEKYSPDRCMCCGRKITSIPGKKPKKFCSDSCRMKWWNARPELVTRKTVQTITCLQCGTVFECYGNKPRKYCSRDCFHKSRIKEKNNEEQKCTNLQNHNGHC